MLDYVTRRFAYMLLMIAAMSLVAFIIIQLPPGDYLTMYVRQLEASGEILDESEIESLRRQYGLDQPQHVRYLKWVGGMFRGDFGRSVQWSKSVISLVGERLLLTIVISLGATLFTYVVAISVGIYSATHQYSLFDYSVTIVGFVGLATPNFLLALVLMIVFNNAFGISIGGLFSPEYSTAPWSLGKVWDMIKHLPVPIIVLGTAGTAGVIRVMRGMLLDELRKQYVITGAHQGAVGAAAAVPLPGAAGAQPDCQHRRLGAAGHRLRRHHHRPGAEPANRRPAAVPRPAHRGHVPGRHHRNVPVLPDHHRHVRVRHDPGRHRPPHPLRKSPDLTHGPQAPRPPPAVAELDQECQKCYTGMEERIHADQEPQDQPCNRSPRSMRRSSSLQRDAGYRCQWQRAISSGKRW